VVVAFLGYPNISNHRQLQHKKKNFFNSQFQQQLILLSPPPRATQQHKAAIKMEDHPPAAWWTRATSIKSSASTSWSPVSDMNEMTTLGAVIAEAARQLWTIPTFIKAMFKSFLSHQQP
jgi:prephenate dehydrogenase